MVRFFLALYFIAKDDVINGTFYTSGNDAIMIFEDSKVIYDSTVDKIPFKELKSRFGTHG